MNFENFLSSLLQTAFCILVLICKIKFAIFSTFPNDSDFSVKKQQYQYLESSDASDSESSDSSEQNHIYAWNWNEFHQQSKLFFCTFLAQYVRQHDDRFLDEQS